MKEPLLPVPSALPIALLPFHAWKTGKNHKEQDVLVLRGHLTASNLLSVRRFTYQNKGNSFLSLILAVHFVELLVKQGQHVFTLHVLLHVGYTFIVS